MKTLFRTFTFSIIFFAVGVSIPMTLLQAEEIDFSCVSYKVKTKTQVSEDYKEYDIALQNRCPGSVYWSMCIELMDPWTHEIQVPLTPSGELKVKQKSRVNLQMKTRLDKSRTREAFQEFYFSIGYAVKPHAKARCVASACESKKRSLRTEFRANDSAWQKVKNAQAARMSTECPQSSWDNTTQEACEAKIRESNQAAMNQFAQKEKELKKKLSAVDPDLCQVHAGD
jgi:hypothetical protein